VKGKKGRKNSEEKWGRGKGGINVNPELIHEKQKERLHKRAVKSKTEGKNRREGGAYKKTRRRPPKKKTKKIPEDIFDG